MDVEVADINLCVIHHELISSRDHPWRAFLLIRSSGRFNLSH